MKTWAARLAEMFKPSEDVFAYFNNDRHGCAPRDAGVFASLCREVGLEPTPVEAEVTVGGYTPPPGRGGRRIA